METAQKIKIKQIIYLTLLYLILSFFTPFTSPASSFAEELPTEKEEDLVTVSPKQGWGDFSVVEIEQKRPLWAEILMWAPNRVLDLLDIFRIDVGGGFSFGAIGRVSKYVQFGYRSVSPLSVRVGLFGRKEPMLFEHSSEFGFSPLFVQSHDRKVCPGEVGVGGDFFIGGIYAGICLDELVDFFGGIFFFDIKKDDL